MKFELITLFPGYFESALRQSLVGKAIEQTLFDIDIIDLRRFATDKHHTADDTPFGGGGGMVMKIEPIDRCLEALGRSRRGEGPPQDNWRLLLTSAAGKRFDQPTAIRLSLCDRLTIVCGHYLGVDERLLELYEIDELSIGDYILTGGEPAALVLVDAVARLLPGVLGNFESALADSHMDGIVGPPVFTRPADYRGLAVPPELVSGDHERISRFRRREALRKSLAMRPDLIETAELSDDDLVTIDELKRRQDQAKG